ncbi:MAG: peptidoglycan-binding protein [Scytonema hyalinum WJT4-NPBG1]|jgi:peptidoglycan hydrolase-like protein with peptidoglycan-binding domain|nr:peptidoglycan-binding protein [Scytonema hyalinum WJT4-NPBG1]
MEESTNQPKPEEQPKAQPKAQPEAQPEAKPELQSLIKPTAISSGSGLPTLRFGARGDSVKALQRLLVSNGYFVKIDGVYGALTEAAVKAFQSGRGLRADGVVGPRTWGILTA